MSKVTLLDAAGDLDAAADEREVKYAGYLTGKRLRERDNLRAEAALVRAADEVVKAAENLARRATDTDDSRLSRFREALLETEDALATFNKISNQEQSSEGR